MALTSETETWSRGQMEAALWRHTATSLYRGADLDGVAGVVPRVFKARIQKLLNIDRIPGLMPFDGVADEHWAFFDTPGEGVGSHDRFTSKQVFLISVAMQLVEQGLKQTDAVFLVRHTRAVLENAFDQIHARPHAAVPVTGTARRHFAFEDDGSSEPLYLDRSKKPLADRSVWMLVRRYETTEMFAEFERKRQGRSIPLFIEPVFYFGLEVVKGVMFDRLHEFRNVLLIELGDLALTLPKYLEESPAVRRGRPRGAKNKPKAPKPRRGK